MKGNTLCGGFIIPLNDFCLCCKNYKTNNKCEAFPDGIPDAIWSGEINHRSYIEGDHGIKFEQAEEVFIDEDIG